MYQKIAPMGKAAPNETIDAGTSLPDTWIRVSGNADTGIRRTQASDTAIIIIKYITSDMN